MKRAGADRDVDRLLDHAAMLRPEFSEGEDEILQVHAATGWTLPLRDSGVKHGP